MVKNLSLYFRNGFSDVYFPQEALQFPLALLTWLNWHKNAVSTATWELLLMGLKCSQILSFPVQKKVG